MENNSITMVIGKVRFTGKWVEIWVRGFSKDDHYNFCSKSKYFWDAIDEVGLENHIYNHGAVGLTMVWKNDGYNYEIDSIRQVIDSEKR